MEIRGGRLGLLCQAVLSYDYDKEGQDVSRPFYQSNMGAGQHIFVLAGRLHGLLVFFFFF